MSGHIGKAQIEDHQVRVMSGEPFDGLGAAAGTGGAEPLGLKSLPEEGDDRLVVIDDQDAGGFVGLGHSTRSGGVHPHRAGGQAGVEPGPLILGTWTTRSRSPSWRIASTKRSDSTGLAMYTPQPN